MPTSGMPPCAQYQHRRRQAHSECVESLHDEIARKHNEIARNIRNRRDIAKIHFLLMTLERLANNIPKLNRLIQTVDLAKTIINSTLLKPETRMIVMKKLMAPEEYTEGITLLREHCHDVLVELFQATFPDPRRTTYWRLNSTDTVTRSATRMVNCATMPGLQKLGCLMDIVVRYLIDVDLTSLPTMGTAKFFAEIALMGTDFATVLRPMLRRWKQHTKHDRALVQQVSQQKYFCGFPDVWILELALGETQGVFKYRSWMDFPVTWMTSIVKLEALAWVSTHGWSPSRECGWSFALSISAFLSARDKHSVNTLCPFAKYIIQSWWTADSQRGYSRVRTLLESRDSSTSDYHRASFKYYPRRLFEVDHVNLPHRT